MTQEDKNTTKCYCGHTTFCDCGPLVNKQTAVDWYFDKIKSHFEHDGVIRHLFQKQEMVFAEEKTSTKGLRKSLELIGDGEIIEKSEYDYKGDRLMYKEYSADNSKILVVHGAYSKSPYGGPIGYRYEIGVYANNPRTTQIGGGYGASGIMGVEHTKLFTYGDQENVYFNENLISKVCEIIKHYFDFSTKKMLSVTDRKIDKYFFIGSQESYLDLLNRCKYI